MSCLILAKINHSISLGAAFGKSSRYVTLKEMSVGFGGGGGEGGRG